MAGRIPVEKAAPVIRPIIDVLKGAREAAGLTRWALAQRIGCKNDQLADWENGVHVPGTYWLAVWAYELGYDLSLTPQETL